MGKLPADLSRKNGGQPPVCVHRVASMVEGKVSNSLGEFAEEHAQSDDGVRLARDPDRHAAFREPGGAASQGSIQSDAEGRQFASRDQLVFANPRLQNLLHGGYSQPLVYVSQQLRRSPERREPSGQGGLSSLGIEQDAEKIRAVRRIETEGDQSRESMEERGG